KLLKRAAVVLHGARDIQAQYSAQEKEIVKKVCAKVGGTNVLLTFVQVTQLFTHLSDLARPC
ncbi:hypothetical protein, partial [Prevotellamassilia timonensis]|uniref:hypothetical protein n=1 Tax=Prevotellamassilia timonensis TaxID=1852370 RepID=UPI003FF0A0B0